MLLSHIVRNELVLRMGDVYAEDATDSTSRRPNVVNKVGQELKGVVGGFDNM